jgi:dipicolinate synthase subunit B
MHTLKDKGSILHMKQYFLVINKTSTDRRVSELARLAADAGLAVYDFNTDFTSPEGKTPIYYFEPRFTLDEQVANRVVDNAIVFGYFRVDLSIFGCKRVKYYALENDEQFIMENNYLTALAQKELLEKRFGMGSRPDILIIGYGKLTAQLEKVLTDYNISILNFNHHKRTAIAEKYSNRAYFEKTELRKFPIIINTIPKPVITPAMLRGITKQNTIYELASAPYGFDFGKMDKDKLTYLVEPSLPGRYYPAQAARAVYDSMVRTTSKPTIVLALTASPCSYAKMLPILADLANHYDIIPVMSQNSLPPNRFCNIDDFKTALTTTCQNPIISTLAAAETLSSRKNIVASAIIPATGNTIAKLANAITDTPVLMSVKALLRNSKPCIIGISTNDALSGNAANIGALLARKNIYFVPFTQDDPINKPFSMMCDFQKTRETIEMALKGKQLQPIVVN